MRIFDTSVQLLKYRVLKEVIKYAHQGHLRDVYVTLPKIISPGPKAEIRCCIYKERAITQERIKIAMGGNKDNPNIVEVIDIACDECPAGGLYVTPSCRGCIAHHCHESCPKDAITIIDRKAVINSQKCVECGRCTKVCPYNAIVMHQRPCVVSCKPKAITVGADKKVNINNDKCIECGACVKMCPFGAIMDKSYVLDVVDMIKGSDNGTNYKLYAVIAPAIVSQFKYVKIEQIVTAIIKMGFHQVVEAALGADITLHKEAKELAEVDILTTSCCPSFVKYIETSFPTLTQYISHSVSPMVETARLIKSTDPTAKVVFIGPCVAKKSEFKLEKCGGAIDSVISFEELQAFIDALDIDAATLEPTPLDNGSFYGRIFAKSGGILQGITYLAEKNNIAIKPVSMNGLTECKVELSKLKSKVSEYNFFEGMACEMGCINGPLCLSRGKKNISDVERYGKQAKELEIDNSVLLYEQLSNSIKK